MRNIECVLATDIDHTLTGDCEALKRLGAQLTMLRERGRLCLFLTTGRTLTEVLKGFEQENIPHADGIISQVGTEIYAPPFLPEMEPLQEWAALLHKQFSRKRAMEFLKGIERAEIQPEHYNTPLKVSYYLDQTPDPEAAVKQIQQRTAKERGAYQIVWSSGKHLDILPTAAGKANAIRFLIDFLQLTPQRVIAAGDSGNDRSMLEEFDYGIVVANAQPELKKLKDEKLRTFLYFAEKPFAAGVEEGLRQFGVL